MLLLLSPLSAVMLLVSMCHVQDKKPTWASLTPTRNIERVIPPEKVDESELGSGYAAAKKLGWQLLERHQMARSVIRSFSEAGRPGYKYAIIDGRHFVPFLNDEWNNVLFNMWCDDMDETDAQA